MLKEEKETAEKLNEFYCRSCRAETIACANTFRKGVGGKEAKSHDKRWHSRLHWQIKN